VGLIKGVAALEGECWSDKWDSKKCEVSGE
jgi:hypothetical protein